MRDDMSTETRTLYDRLEDRILARVANLEDVVAAHQPRVQPVAQPVAEQIDRQDQRRNRQPGYQPPTAD